MSLRGFHLIFITLAAFFCAGIGVWIFFLERAPEAGLKAFGGVSFVVAVSLVFYGISFYRKANKISL